MKRLLIITIFLVVFAAQSAHATVPSWDEALSGIIPTVITSVDIPIKGSGWFVSKENRITGISTDTIIDRIIPSWDGIVKLLANTMITLFKEAMLDWVRNGFDAGGPLFVQNPTKFFGEVADEATGAYIAELGEIVGGDPEFFCNNFAPQLIVNFGLSYRGKTFGDRAKCTLSDVAENIEDVTANFSNYGWNGFFKLQAINNNPLALDLFLF